MGRIIFSLFLGATIGLLACPGKISAQTFALPEGTTGLTPIEGRLMTVEQVHVSNLEIGTGAESKAETRVTMEFILQGCLDSLMPLMTHHEVRGQRVILYVTALNVHNQRSQTARCFAIPRASAQVAIPGAFQRNQIRVVFVGVDPRLEAGL